VRNTATARRFAEIREFLSFMKKTHSLDIILRETQADDKEWIRQLIATHWGSEISVSRGKIFRPHELPGFLALTGTRRVGLITYHIERRRCEIVTLNSLCEAIGIGTALISAVRGRALETGCRKIWLITTNDNLNALRFYQKRGFVLVAVHRNAMEHSRRLKPEIPLTGGGGIILRDEIELEMALAPGKSE
jgi:GNAT superfamily N-acetyltransferase